MPPRKHPVRRRQPRQGKLQTNSARLRGRLAHHRGNVSEKSLLEELISSESLREEYLELYHHAPVAYLTLNRAGIIRTVNLAATYLLGYPGEKLVGRPLLPLIALADRRRFLAHLSRLRRGQARATTELELLRHNQPTATVQLISTVRASRRAWVERYPTVIVDISARKKAERRTAALGRLGLMLSSAQDPAAMARAFVDAAQMFCPWDACFVLLHDPSSNTVTDIVNMDTIEGQRVPVPPMLRGRRPSPMIQRTMKEGPQLILRKSPEDQRPLTTRFGDTSRVSMSLMFVPLRLQGQSIGVLSVQSYQVKAYTPQDLEVLQGLADHVAGALARLQARAALQGLNEQLEARVAERTAEIQQYRDHLEELVQERTRELETTNERLRSEIASRQLADEALLRTTAELKRSNLELEQFAYVASHDLQEPLRAVGGYVRLLQHRCPELLDAKCREYIEGAAEGANRMEQQISDLLALSRIGTQGVRLAPVNLAEALNAALHTLQFTIKSTGASVTHGPLPTLLVDESQVILLFQNLIANALKFRGEAPPRLHISARNEKERWVVSVRDNGIGIAPQYAERVFQVFQRLHTRKKYPGTGIGLAICRKIVERHGGTIWVESHLGKGSTFCFSLPNGAATQK